MQIYFERTGGFAGMHMTATVNTKSLPAKDANDLLQLVDTVGFFDLPAAINTTAQGRDRFHYKLTVEVEGRKHTVERSEAALPEALQPLIQRLTAMARTTRRS